MAVSDSREQAPTDDLTDPFGDAHVAERDVGAPAPVDLHDRAGLHEVQEHLAHEERVALGLVDEGLGEVVRGIAELVTGGRGHQRADAVDVETMEVEALDARPRDADRRARR